MRRHSRGHYRSRPSRVSARLLLPLLRLLIELADGGAAGGIGLLPCGCEGGTVRGREGEDAAAYASAGEYAGA
jgi:hypothetical protein